MVKSNLLSLKLMPTNERVIINKELILRVEDHEVENVAGTTNLVGRIDLKDGTHMLVRENTYEIMGMLGLQ